MNKRLHKIKKVLVKYRVIVIFVVSSLVISTIFYFASQEKAVEAYIEIPQNTSTKDVALILRKNNIIKNPYLFLLYVKLHDIKIAAGKYRLSSDMSYKTICSMLEKGVLYKKSIRFTIPEGFTVEQIAQKLDKLGIVDANKFLNLINTRDFNIKYKYNSSYVKYKLEGFLFPDTYEVYPGTSEEEIIKMMLNRFLQVFETLKAKTKGQLDDIQTIILASIVEKEAKRDEERPIIAGVFINRLMRNMMLQSCATVEYILPYHKEVLSYSDLKTDSYYNTYLHKGLPPSAICNPGIKSLQAALNPQKTDYLFFVAKKDGSHVFSKTFEDHLKEQKLIQGGNR